jgi:hypothetical protein
MQRRCTPDQPYLLEFRTGSHTVGKIGSPKFEQLHAEQIRYSRLDNRNEVQPCVK